MKYLSKKNQRKGFTMIESIFAIFIIGTCLITFFVVMAAMIRAQYNARDIIIASNLAQEGIEMARNYRDNNWKNGQKAFCTGSGSGTATNPCNTGSGISDGIFPANKACSGEGDCYNENDSKFPIISDNLRSKFERKIRIAGDANSKTITSTVKIKKSDKIIVITDILYPWADAN